MAEVRNLSDIQQEIAFTEYDFYQRYVTKTEKIGLETRADDIKNDEFDRGNTGKSAD